MKKQTITSFILLVSFLVSAQNQLKSDLLYVDQTPLEIKLSYSNKEMNAKTDDSTYIKTNMEFLHEEKWNSIEVKLRARGNFRRNTCYFPPVKMKIKKDQRAGTLFDGNKSLKLVLPCKIESENNDNILQEFIAYKIYEKISPYHFKTRRVNVDFNEIEKMSLLLETEPYNVLKDKIDKIHQIYENGYYYIKRVTKEEIAASYIESIYNIFNIINKRHDDIEKKLGISNKIEIV